MKKNFDLMGLKFSVVDTFVYPLAINSGVGSVKGGIAPFLDMPEYFSQLRFEDNKIATINRFRHGDPTAVLLDKSLCEVYDGLHLYMGPMHQHYGHFIVESVTRLWLLSVLHKAFLVDDIKLLILPELKNIDERDSYNYSRMNDWQIKIIEHYHFKRINEDDIKLLLKPARFTSLVVPQQGFVWGKSVNQAYLKVLNEFCDGYKKLHDAPRNLKIYICRGRVFLKDGYVAGESVISEFFVANGYCIYDPNVLSFEQQYDMAARCSHAFGVQSSAFHIFNLVGAGIVNLGILQRLSEKISNKFINSIASHVSSISIHKPNKSFGNEASYRSLVVFDNVMELKKYIYSFDKSLNMDLFDSSRYHYQIDADLKDFLLERVS